MKIGIDSYCYHRFFGEVYAQQRKPAKQMTPEDFIRRAKQLGVDGVSLESCFIPRFDAAYLSEVKAMLDEKDFSLINVLPAPTEVITGTDLLIPAAEIAKSADKLPKDKGAKIVVYCQMGRMAPIAAEALVKLGYTNVFSLAGGMTAWKEAGYPLFPAPKPAAALSTPLIRRVTLSAT